LSWFLQALEAQLQSAQEATTDVLDLDVEYHKGQGAMRLRAQTKITSFIERERLHGGRITPHDTPMTPGLAKAMTKKNCPVTDLQKKEMKSSASQYRTYATNTVHVNCKNVARLLSRFLSNPGLEHHTRWHHKAVMYALGYLYHHCEKCTSNTSAARTSSMTSSSGSSLWSMQALVVMILGARMETR
jgi:hypothetical protein